VRGTYRRSQHSTTDGDPSLQCFDDFRGPATSVISPVLFSNARDDPLFRAPPRQPPRSPHEFAPFGGVFEHGRCRAPTRGPDRRPRQFPRPGCWRNVPPPPGAEFACERGRFGAAAGEAPPGAASTILLYGPGRRPRARLPEVAWANRSTNVPAWGKPPVERASEVARAPSRRGRRALCAPRRSSTRYFSNLHFHLSFFRRAQRRVAVRDRPTEPAPRFFQRVPRRPRFRGSSRPRDHPLPPRFLEEPARRRF